MRKKNKKSKGSASIFLIALALFTRLFILLSNNWICPLACRNITNNRVCYLCPLLADKAYSSKIILPHGHAAHTKSLRYEGFVILLLGLFTSCTSACTLASSFMNMFPAAAFGSLSLRNRITNKLGKPHFKILLLMWIKMSQKFPGNWK